MTGSVRPTKKQQELLLYIEQFIQEHGYSPSYREIMNGCQYTSVATVALHVGNLIKRGHLRKRDHSARSIEVVKHPEDDSRASETVLVKSSGMDDGSPIVKKWVHTRIDQLLSDAERDNSLTEPVLEDVRALLRVYTLAGATSEAEQLAGRLEALS